MEIGQLAEDTQKEECWSKADDVVDVDEIGKTSYNCGTYWYLARGCHVQNSKGVGQEDFERVLRWKDVRQGRRAQ